MRKSSAQDLCGENAGEAALCTKWHNFCHATATMRDDVATLSSLFSDALSLKLWYERQQYGLFQGMLGLYSSLRWK